MERLQGECRGNLLACVFGQACHEHQIAMVWVSFHDPALAEHANASCAGTPTRVFGI
jgi:hypothetical protein